jgi:Zn-dependent protease/predicted transcriptional regulator
MAVGDEPYNAAGGNGGVRWTAGHVRGVPVYVGPSVLLLAVLFTWWLGQSFMQRPMFSGTVVDAWLAALATTILFLACILLHEIGHTVTSLDRNIEVRSISLFLLGGVTESVGEPQRARDEIVIVGIGPLISLVTGAVFGLLVWALPDFTVAELVAGWLAWLNCAMAIFNLVPGYPLDGGRLLRAVVWMVTSSRYFATRVAAGVGQAFAAALVLGAVLSLVDVSAVEPRPLRDALRLLSVLGLWGGVVGFFLFRSSADAYRTARLREQLGRTRARDLMGSVPPTVPADISLDQLVVRLQQRPAILWPVGRPLVGGVRLEDLDRVPRREWAHTTVTEVIERDVFVDENTPMDQALDMLTAAPDRMLIVVRDGEPVGLLTPSLVGDVAT